MVKASPASAHSRLVVLLSRLGLVVSGVGVLAAFLVMAPLTAGGDVSFVLDKNKVEVARERLRIQAARYRGEDARGRAFTIDAGSAVQRSSATQRRVVSGSKPGAGMTIVAPWVVHPRLPMTMPKQW